MPNRKKWFEEHRKAIQAQVAKGLGSRAIFNLGLEVFAGSTENAIKAFMNRGRLTNPILSERIRNSRRLTSREKELLIKFLEGEGLNLPDSVIARQMNISESSVYWFRMKMIGRVKGRRRSETGEANRRKKISRYYMIKRVATYEKLCALQTAMEERGESSPLKACNCCGAKRFELGQFFFKSSYGGKRDRRVFFFGMCRVCHNEVAGLKRMGKTEEEVARCIYRMFEIRPVKTLEYLRGLLKFHKKTKSRASLKVCRHCRAKWPWCWQYFHQVYKNENFVLTDTCLTCPAVRRFFSV